MCYRFDADIWNVRFREGQLSLITQILECENGFWVVDLCGNIAKLQVKKTDYH